MAFYMYGFISVYSISICIYKKIDSIGEEGSFLWNTKERELSFE